ncbi:putative disease resistance protein RGA3 isoform X3 [Rosa chinensis]|uniref:putative disease resistance protein RGA3 isoform X3 n=1 Tax=Rosa chinensis TaxID=74649 RepID=UPI001AD92535|nr:putative disease resistance protein RGA3 isoform X3 [Rosa chinensis]
MAEALISVLLEQLASITRQQVQLQVKLVVDVKKEVENLCHNFQAIEAVLKDAEERQVKEASVKLWLDDLKDVSNEMEDVMDDWNTEILRLQIEKQEKAAGNALETTKKKATRRMRRLRHRPSVKSDAKGVKGAGPATKEK